MLWVTFACRGGIGVPVATGANIKDENYFALQSPGKSANSPPGRTLEDGCRKMEAPGASALNLRGAASP